MFGFGKGFGRGFGWGRRKHRRRKGRFSEIPLLYAKKNQKYIVISNMNIKTLEMGIYPGAILEVIKEGNEDTNMIIKINDAQIIIPPNVAKEILVR